MTSNLAAMLRSFPQFGIGWAQEKTAKPCRGVVPPGKQTVGCSGGQPLKAMIQTADLWIGYDLSGTAGLIRLAVMMYIRYPLPSSADTPDGKV